MNDLVLIAIIAGGLLLFTFMIYVSRKQRGRIRESRNRIKKHWKDRME